MDEEKEYKVIASRTFNVEFRVYATDEDDAREQVEDGNLDLDDGDIKNDYETWDVSDVEEVPVLRLTAEQMAEIQKQREAKESNA